MFHSMKTPQHILILPPLSDLPPVATGPVAAPSRDRMEFPLNQVQTARGESHLTAYTEL